MSDNFSDKYLDSMRVKSIMHKTDNLMKIEVLNAEDAVHEMQVEFFKNEVNSFTTEHRELLKNLPDIEQIKQDDQARLEAFSNNFVKICDQNDELNQGIRNTRGKREALQKLFAELDRDVTRIMDSENDWKMNVDRNGMYIFFFKKKKLKN